MAYSRRNGIDKALDQVDRVLENLGQKQNERKNQENKSVQCHSSEKLARNKHFTAKENVKSLKTPRGVLLPRRTIKADQAPSESSKSRISTHAEPTQSSLHRMLLTEKIQKQPDNILPYVPVGKKSISHNTGIKIQQDLGKLKLDPKTASIETKYLTMQNSENNVNTGSNRTTFKCRESKKTPQLCEEEIYQALKNINKEISDFIVQSS